MAKLGKRTRAAREAFAGKEDLTVEEAVALVKANASAKFDETVELAVNLGVDPRHADQMVRGVVGLPNGTGKSVRVAVFARGDKADQAREAGADFVGHKDILEKIEGGWTDFDVVVAAPDVMGDLGKLGRVLGPRGLMPNPKAGTVTPNIGQAVTEVKAGKIEFRVDKTGVVHVAVGKASFDEEKLSDNILAFMNTIAAAKPSSAKGRYIKSMTISSTMGPGIHIDAQRLVDTSDD